MLYRQKSDAFIRRFDDIGYVVNKSSLTDCVVDAAGLVFLSALSRKPQSIEELSAKIAKAFIDADIMRIKNDASNFYDILEKDGFIVSGETEDEVDGKDKRFSYSAIDPESVKTDFSPALRRAEKTTQEFLQEYFKEKPHLMSFQIELTSRCNERCVHCYIPHENKSGDIDPAFFYDVLEQCREMGVLEITLSGGEPMMHPQFHDFLRKAKEYDFSVNILSNLTLLDDETIAELKSNRRSAVQVSLYSMKSEIHDAITQLPGSCEKTKKAILKLIENDIPLQISCPTMKQNKGCYVDVKKWAQKLKCHLEADFVMMARCDGSIENLDNRLSLDETEQLLKDIIENNPEYQKQVLKNDFDTAAAKDTSNDIICSVCIDSFCMVADGNVYPCAGWQSYVCGNLKESSLREIWLNSPKVKYLRGLRKKDFPICLQCPVEEFCGNCMVRNGNEDPDGDFLKVNEHFCKVVALNRKVVMEWKTKAAM